MDVQKFYETLARIIGKKYGAEISVTVTKKDAQVAVLPETNKEPERVAV